jgi:hypothetical protein
VDEISFRSTPEVWGYFSVKGGGAIHEYSDSQFGHLFAKGETREAAIRAMVVALKEIKIRWGGGGGEAGGCERGGGCAGARNGCRALCWGRRPRAPTSVSGAAPGVCAPPQRARRLPPLVAAVCRGEIRTIVDYVVELIQSPDFVANTHHTGWLDARISAQVGGPAWVCLLEMRRSKVPVRAEQEGRVCTTRATRFSCPQLSSWGSLSLLG